MREPEPRSPRQPLLRQYGFTLVSLGVFGISVALSVHTLRLVRESASRAASRRATARELRRLEERLAPYLAAQAACEATASGQPPPLSSLAQAALPVARADDVREVSRERLDGWTLCRQEAAWSDAPLEGVVALIRAAETSRPPWRVTRCTVRSSVFAPGRGSVSLQFETLTRDTAPP